MFRDLFWRIWTSKGYTLPSDTRKCYMFEMMTPEHVIVVRPTEAQIYLHGVRNLVSLQEEDPQPVAEKVTVVSIFGFLYLVINLIKISTGGPR